LEVRIIAHPDLWNFDFRERAECRHGLHW